MPSGNIFLSIGRCAGLDKLWGAVGWVSNVEEGAIVLVYKKNRGVKIQKESKEGGVVKLYIFYWHLPGHIDLHFSMTDLKRLGKILTMR